jgi:hypothetical protein
VAVERTAVNRAIWSVGLGFNQGEVVSGHARTRYRSGPTAGHDGAPQHAGDRGARLALSPLGVTRLAIPGQLVELDGTADA